MELQNLADVLKLQKMVLHLIKFMDNTNEELLVEIMNLN